MSKEINETKSLATGRVDEIDKVYEELDRMIKVISGLEERIDKLEKAKNKTPDGKKNVFNAKVTI